MGMYFMQCGIVTNQMFYILVIFKNIFLDLLILCICLCTT